jgi:hypothetical protein
MLALQIFGWGILLAALVALVLMLLLEQAEAAGASARGQALPQDRSQATPHTVMPVVDAQGNGPWSCVDLGVTEAAPSIEQRLGAACSLRDKSDKETEREVSSAINAMRVS